jgi:hypothetical protein
MNIEICETRPKPAVQLLAPGHPVIVQAPQPTPHHEPGPHPSTSLKPRLSLSHQIRVKSAEYWLRLGEADEAVRELEALPSKSWNHPWAVRVRVAALEVLRERTGVIVQAVQA